MWNLRKNDTDELTYKTESQTEKKKKKNYSYQRGKVKKEMATHSSVLA